MRNNFYIGCSLQQVEYTTKQYQIDEERRKRQEEYGRQKEREEAEAIRLEKERILQLYRNARYGDIIQVNISDGSIAFIGERKDYGISEKTGRNRISCSLNMLQY